MSKPDAIATLSGSDAIRTECQRALHSRRRYHSIIAWMTTAEMSIVSMMVVITVSHVILVMLAPSILVYLTVPGDLCTTCIGLLCLGFLLLSLYAVKAHIVRTLDQNQQRIDKLLLLLERLCGAIPGDHEKAGSHSHAALSGSSGARKRASGHIFA